jgi:hypothetical protein
VRRSFVLSLLVVVAAALLATVRPAPAATTSGAGDDVTVVAVIDGGFSPYHWDYLAEKMPQATNDDSSDDLPLTQPPDTWLPGFPSPSNFATYASLDLTLDGTNPNADPARLDAADAAIWSGVRHSNRVAQHYYWLPGTKVIGALTFEGDELLSTAGQIHGTTSEHGMGSASVSVGNIHGTCPECLLVFLEYNSSAGGEAAIDWAMNQPWIDVITNSYGFHFPTTLDGNIRPQIYNNSDVSLQRTASSRGQTVFFSAGNGVENAFVIPQSTLLTSQKGPDWIVTVGAISSDVGPEPIFAKHASYTGTGKPVDVASLGELYPSSYEATTVSNSGEFGFSGTSNATPVIAGTYARALYLARRDLAGLSRVQAGGVIATGGGFACGAARPTCELGDGTLTAKELRTRLFHGARHTPPGMTVGGFGPSLPPVGEDEFLNEGHGSYLARSHDDDEWLTEFDRLLGPLEGRTAAPARPDGEREWMRVDSWCRQHIWGKWAGGYHTGQALPPIDVRWPVRSSLLAACPALQPPPRSAPLLEI